jgi:beta-lactamase class D
MHALHRAVTRGALLLCLASPAAHAQTDSVADLSRFFGRFQGAFVSYDTRTRTTLRHNVRLCAERLPPASTFKIPNSLIGLESGVIRDRHFVIPWDSVRRPNAAWNRDHDLASAIAFSVVPYYQELARRVGAGRMQHFLDTLGYGNRDISGGIDRFWLGSSLRISPDEQVLFLRRLRENALPFSRRSIDIVKEILIQESNDRWTLRAKTGMADFDSSRAVGWYVGWVERAEGAVVFAACITTERRKEEGDEIFDRRKPVAMAILKALGIID